MRRHYDAGTSVQWTQKVHLYTCGQCGVEFGVSGGYRFTGQPIHCPAGHAQENGNKVPDAPEDAVVPMWLYPGAAVHLEMGGRVCRYHHGNRHRLSEVAWDYFEPHNICVYCLKRARRFGEVARIKSMLRNVGVAVDEWTGW